MARDHDPPTPGSSEAGRDLPSVQATSQLLRGGHLKDVALEEQTVAIGAPHYFEYPAVVAEVLEVVDLMTREPILKIGTNDIGLEVIHFLPPVLSVKLPLESRGRQPGPPGRRRARIHSLVISDDRTRFISRARPC